MIDISRDIASRITLILDETRDAIPSEMNSLVSLLRSQITQLKCDEGLLIEFITLLQDYYRLSDSPINDDRSSKKDGKKEENEKLGALIIALYEVQDREMQTYGFKMRR